MEKKKKTKKTREAVDKVYTHRKGGSARMRIEEGGGGGGRGDARQY